MKFVWIAVNNWPRPNGIYAQVLQRVSDAKLLKVTCEVNEISMFDDRDIRKIDLFQATVTVKISVDDITYHKTQEQKCWGTVEKAQAWCEETALLMSTQIVLSNG